jgi:hypothetical protein
VTVFHSRDGFYFERQDNGAVSIVIRESGHSGALILRQVTLPSNEWASVVASMTAEGENRRSWKRAVQAQVDD